MHLHQTPKPPSRQWKWPRKGHPDSFLGRLTDKHTLRCNRHTPERTPRLPSRQNHRQASIPTQRIKTKYHQHPLPRTPRLLSRQNHRQTCLPMQSINMRYRRCPPQPNIRYKRAQWHEPWQPRRKASTTNHKRPPQPHEHMPNMENHGRRQYQSRRISSALLQYANSKMRNPVISFEPHPHDRTRPGLQFPTLCRTKQAHYPHRT